MSNDDFPIPVKVRMWAFMAANYTGNTQTRLYHADMISEFLWADYVEADEYQAKEDIN